MWGLEPGLLSDVPVERMNGDSNATPTFEALRALITSSDCSRLALSKRLPSVVVNVDSF